MKTEKSEKNNLFVSIIMPAYNASKFIEQSIESVMNQTYKNYELIIIDDCSKDNTYEIVNKYKSEQIRILKNEKNSGVSETRNRGVKESKYDWIAFLDSDDLWEPTKLEKQVKFINENKNAKILFTASKFIDENNNPYDYELQVPSVIEYKELLKQNLISCSSALVLKEYLTQYKMAGDNMHEDFAVWLSILKNEKTKAYGINEPLLIYRISTNSKSSNKIKAAKMNYNTYKYIGLNFFERIYYMVIYTIRGLKKYKNIKK